MTTVAAPNERTTPNLLGRPGREAVGWLDDLGRQLAFYAAALRSMPAALVHYRGETLRLLGDVALGRGALAAFGGSIGVVVAMSFFTGIEVGLQGYEGLEQIGASALTGFISAYFNTREISPLVAGVALSATVGCGFTAQLGAMRISEEIDALEVMAVRPIPFLVSSRVLAGLVAVIPLYFVGLLASYLSTRTVVTRVYGQSAGTYDHYFHLFLPPADIGWSVFKVSVFATLVIISHCWYG
ncbi:MlaE family ABC transporter permease, partial [Nocardioides sp. CF8]|uniref:MlaE family ABC transporter permease n=1 Tax=Nocardioides sp. CF8 TaxID=110319 RepID=UPI00056B82D2